MNSYVDQPVKVLLLMLISVYFSAFMHSLQHNLVIQLWQTESRNLKCFAAILSLKYIVHWL